jgi:deazaflavin-dependent oxidoreductase (nitroreductase family)
VALPHALARFNRVVTNPVALHVATWMPGFGVVVHRGRRSGAIYRTPVNVFRRPGEFEFALTYGEGDWVRNVLAAREAELVTRGRTHRIVDPIVVADPGHLGLPVPVRLALRAFGVDRTLLVDEASA